MVRPIFAICAIIIIARFSCITHAEEAQPAVYQRVSTQATIARANWSRNGGNWGGGGWGWGYPGFYNPWFAPQFYGGTWYQRPYPDHLIYNNVRSAMPSIQGSPLDCPCLEAPVEQAISP